MYTQISKRTFELIFDRKYRLIKALFIPFIILTIIEYFTNEQVEDSIGSANFYLLIGLSLFITIIMSITIHRILLLDESSTPEWGIFKFGSREVTFILKAIGLGIVLSIVAMGLFLIASFISTVLENLIGKEMARYLSIILVFLVIVFIGILFSRISLVFPAVAIDKPIEFDEALDISENYKLLIFITVLVIPTILGLLLGFVYGLAINFLIELISEKLSVLLSLLNIFITIFTIGFLSTTYEYVISKQPVKKENSSEINEVEYIQNENSYKINIDDRYEVSFTEIKKSLFNQYESLGFTNIKLDKEDSWLLKNPEVEKAYILLTHSKNQYVIETFNVSKKPIIDIR